jgi:hypothetical protein
VGVPPDAFTGAEDSVTEPSVNSVSGQDQTPKRPDGRPLPHDLKDPS